MLAVEDRVARESASRRALKQFKENENNRTPPPEAINSSLTPSQKSQMPPPVSAREYKKGVAKLKGCIDELHAALSEENSSRRAVELDLADLKEAFAVEAASA